MEGEEGRFEISDLRFQMEGEEGRFEISDLRFQMNRGEGDLRFQSMGGDGVGLGD
jgi:hypothetical protein